MTDYFDLTGKVALITGATRGLGYEMAKGLAARGADIVVSSRKAEACDAVAEEIRAMGRRAVSAPCHVGRWEELPGLVDKAYGELGKVDILINNAGMSPTVPAAIDMTEDLFDKTVGVNFKGPFRLSTLIGARMVEGDGGSIINVTSIAAVKPDPVYAVYAGAKAALNVITRSLAMEYGPKVRVNAIMAGPFWTDIAKAWREEADKTSTSALRRIGRPEEVVTTVLYLASPASSYTTGAVIRLDGGIL